MAQAPRSWLFVPGDSDKKLAKVAGCGADAVIIDLEDSVAAINKGAARALTAAFLQEANVAGGPQLWVRVNPLDSGLCEQDVAAIVPNKPTGLVLPKAEGRGDVLRLSRLIDEVAGSTCGVAIHAIATETARSIFRLADFADGPVERLSAISWGAEDLATAIGAASNRHDDGRLFDAFRHARTLALFAAHAAGVQAVDGLHGNFRDLAGLKHSSAVSRQEGFTGRLAIHPDQVAIINEAYLPSATEVVWAERIVAAFAEAGDVGTVGIDGTMIDRPHLQQSEQLLARYRSYLG